ncbi:MAG TPA: hypothetical protein PK263_03370 [bacterium]|nr:hypothetical protein [bacterium]
MNKTRNMLFLGWITLIFLLYFFVIGMGLALGRLISLALEGL